MMYPMDVHTNKSQRYGLFSALTLAALVFGAVFVGSVHSQGFGLIYETTAAIIVLVLYILVADRIFVR